MLIVIPVSWTIFNISDLPTLGNYIKRLFFLPVKGSVKIDTFPEVSGIVRHLLVATRNLRHLLYADSNPPVKAVLQDMGM